MSWDSTRCGAPDAMGHPCVLQAGHAGDHAGAASAEARIAARPRGLSPPAVLVGLGIVAVLAVAAVLRPSGGTSPPTGDAPADTSGVPWSDYASSVRSRIDGLAAAKDCEGLQAEFDTADANNAGTMTRTGHNNAALMGYIDIQMRAAGCY
jgi:hypothetical protein